MRTTRATIQQQGFTLIEMSIVLVIIGLIVGGILVGRDLIAASEVNAQISQITKYNSAVNTFVNKYGALPGDLPATVATQFGFAARGTLKGEGDGNGIIEDISGCGNPAGAGETVMFWVDLSTVGLIDGEFTTANSTTNPGSNVTMATTPNISAYLPAARIGHNDFVYAWSLNSDCMGGEYNGFGGNFYSVSMVTSIPGTLWNSNPGIPVIQAYNIDKKMDDGLPQSGNVLAFYVTNIFDGLSWAGSGAVYSAPYTTSTAQSTTSCFDNGSGSGAQQYSLGTTANGGSGLNCALSFKFQ